MMMTRNLDQGPHMMTTDPVPDHDQGVFHSALIDNQ